MKELWDSFKQPNERVSGVPKEWEIEWGGGESEEIMVKSFMKIINLQIQETQKIPSTRNMKENPPRHSLTKLVKTSDRKNIKSTQRKKDMPNTEE